MIKSFYTASLLLDVLTVFGELSEEVSSTCESVWRQTSDLVLHLLRIINILLVNQNPQERKRTNVFRIIFTSHLLVSQIIDELWFWWKEQVPHGVTGSVWSPLLVWYLKEPRGDLITPWNTKAAYLCQSTRTFKSCSVSHLFLPGVVLLRRCVVSVIRMIICAALCCSESEAKQTEADLSISLLDWAAAENMELIWLKQSLVLSALMCCHLSPSKQTFSCSLYWPSTSLFSLIPSNPDSWTPSGFNPEPACIIPTPRWVTSAGSAHKPRWHPPNNYSTVHHQHGLNSSRDGQIWSNCQISDMYGRGIFYRIVSSSVSRTSSTGSTPAGRRPTSTTVWRMARRRSPGPLVWTRTRKQVGRTDRPPVFSALSVAMVSLSTCSCECEKSGSALCLISSASVTGKQQTSHTSQLLISSNTTGPNSDMFDWQYFWGLKCPKSQMWPEIFFLFWQKKM